MAVRKPYKRETKKIEAENKKRTFTIKQRSKAEFDNYLSRLKDDPKYADILQKAEAQAQNSLEFLVETTPNSTINDDVNIYTEAELVMELVINQEVTLGMLDLKQKAYLLYYLERYNKRVGRITDILTRIPMSSMRLQKPQTQWQIVNDYIYKKYTEMFSSFSFQEMLEKMVRHYWLFSYSAVLIEDDYEFVKESNILNEISVKSNKLAEFLKVKESPDEDTKDMERLTAIDKRYLKNSKDVTSKERKEVLDSVLKIHSPAYRGPLKFTVLSALSTLDRNENTDVDYYIYRIPITENLKETISSIQAQTDATEDELTEVINEAEKIGYTRAMINALFDYDEIQTTKGVNGDQEQQILVDSDPYNRIGMYVAVFQRAGLARLDNSVFNRVLSDCIDLAISTRRLREKMNRGFKKDVLVTLGDKEDRYSIDELQAALTDAANNQEGSITVTNMNASVQDIDLTVNSNLDLNEMIDHANRNISEGVGISESLITDSTDSYANSFLKTILMENEFVSFRNSIKRFIEKKIFEPIALKMGFVIEDEWGEIIPVYPEIKFDKLNLAHGSDALATLQEMAANGQVPMEMVYDALGIDPAEAMSKVREEQFTLLNQTLRDAFSGAVGDLAGQVALNMSDLQQKLAKNFDIDPKDVEQAIKKARQDDTDRF